MVLESILRNGDRPCLGHRKLIAEESGQNADGKVIKKKLLDSEYTWLSYREVNQQIDAIVKGLYAAGVKPGDKVIIMLETRVEWQLFAQAVLRMGATLCTMYATLGKEGIVYSINELEATLMITNVETLELFEQLSDQIPRIQTIVTVGRKSTRRNRYKVVTQEELIEAGRHQSIPAASRYIPKGDDIAVIMYTSGSTGLPKGVQMTQRSIVKAFLAMNSGFGLHNWSEAVYLAFLPLAHIFEFMIEMCVLTYGGALGYGTPLTLTDNSPGLIKGCKGDGPALRPTILIVVPLLLDKIRNAVTAQIDAKGAFMKTVFQFAVSYKAWWQSYGFETPVLNQIIFKKTRTVLGDRLNEAIVGAAPLSPQTQRFARSALCIDLLQGYGATESMAVTSCMDYNDHSTGRIGPPFKGISLRLRAWTEGNYKPTDKPNPRGELLIGAEHISMGYYKREQEDKEAFFVDPKNKNVRWFATGDIAEIYPDGTVKIIDRKKDLIKLQNGEYVSLGKVEAALKSCLYIENICVFAESSANFVVALVLPARQKTLQLAKEVGKNYLSWEELCLDNGIVSRVLSSVQESGKSSGLGRVEIPIKLKLCSEDWTPNSGLVTASLKIRRKQLVDFYQQDIKCFYLSNKDPYENTNGV